jgi:hypothetical protein
MFPSLTDLQVIDLEDPYYYLNVDGERLKLESVKHLRQQSLFQEACMVQLKFRPPTLKEKDWIIITNQLLNNAEVTEPAEGMRTEDQLQNHLEEFCLNKRVGKEKLSVFIVKEFDKKDTEYKPKKLKEDAPY